MEYRQKNDLWQGLFCKEIVFFTFKWINLLN